MEKRRGEKRRRVEEEKSTEKEEMRGVRRVDGRNELLHVRSYTLTHSFRFHCTAGLM